MKKMNCYELENNYPEATRKAIDNFGFAECGSVAELIETLATSEDSYDELEEQIADEIRGFVSE